MRGIRFEIRPLSLRFEIAPLDGSGIPPGSLKIIKMLKAIKMKFKMLNGE
jgi:hypothetical protein